MEFKSKDTLQRFINSMPCIGQGLQGICYLDNKNKVVFKVFNSYLEDDIREYKEEDILKFSSIKNKTFIWPSDVIIVNNEPVGYIMPYKKANNLYRLDPLEINLNHFENAIQKAQKDIRLLTNKDVTIYDIMYNILYTNSNFYVIDTLEYANRKTTYKENIEGFNIELKRFLISGYFDNFIKENKLLLELYKDSQIDILIFLKEFRKQLNEYMDKNIITLESAKILVKKDYKSLYPYIRK